MTTTAQANGAVTAQSGHWPEVKIGDETYTVVPQRLGRLKKHLGREFSTLADIEIDGGLGGFVNASLERAHRILKVMIPDLMPAWEFCGYRSQEAMENDEFLDDGKEYGPTLPDVIGAFEAVMRVNRLDLFKHLGKYLDEDLVKAYVNKALVDSLATTTSPSSSSTPGLPTPSMMSGTTRPTSPTSAD